MAEQDIAKEAEQKLNQADSVTNGCGFSGSFSAFVDQGIGKFELRLDSVSDNFPKLTYREAIKTYFYIDISQSGETSLSEFRSIYDWYGISPTQLDVIADPMFYVDQWGQFESPNAQAYYYLCDLDLTGAGQGPGPLIGDLHFRMGEVS